MMKLVETAQPSGEEVRMTVCDSDLEPFKPSFQRVHSWPL